MRLADKARGLDKQAVLGAAVSAIAQNAIGIPIARSKGFKKSVAKSALMGAAGKKAPRTAKSLATDALAGVAAPEVNAAKNQAYKGGQDLAKKIGLDKNNKRQLVEARLAAAGDEKGLARIGKSKSELASKIRKGKKEHGIPDIPKSVTKEHTKSISKLKDGSRAPASNKAAIIANAAILPLPGGASTALVNASKLAASTNAAGKTKVIQKANKAFIKDPIKKSFDSGKKGKKFDQKISNVKSILMNPFTEEANKQAHKAGSKVK